MGKIVRETHQVKKNNTTKQKRMRNGREEDKEKANGREREKRIKSEAIRKYVDKIG